MKISVKPDLPVDVGMLDGLYDPVFLVDSNYLVVDCNRSAKQLIGKNPLGSELNALIESNHINNAVDASLAGRPGSRSEVFLPYPIARHFELSVWRLPDLDSPGPAWAMLVLRDVTASKKAVQMRADFVANVSHELRSPLSSLLGFIETLRALQKMT